MIGIVFEHLLTHSTKLTNSDYIGVMVITLDDWGGRSLGDGQEYGNTIFRTKYFSNRETQIEDLNPSVDKETLDLIAKKFDFKWRFESFCTGPSPPSCTGYFSKCAN